MIHKFRPLTNVCVTVYKSVVLFKKHLSQYMTPQICERDTKFDALLTPREAIFHNQKSKPGKKTVQRIQFLLVKRSFLDWVNTSVIHSVLLPLVIKTYKLTTAFQRYMKWSNEAVISTGGVGLVLHHDVTDTPIPTTLACSDSRDLNSPSPLKIMG